MVGLLEETDIDFCTHVAARRFERYRGHFGVYQTKASNSLSSHLVGVLGEYAVQKLLLSRYTLVKDWEDIDGAEYDFQIHGVPIEVKTWSNEYWTNLGRCIRPAHLPKYKRDKAIIIWSSVWLDISEITIHGWNYASDISDRHKTKTGRYKIDNYQIPDQEIRPIETLLDYIDSEILK